MHIYPCPSLIFLIFLSLSLYVVMHRCLSTSCANTSPSSPPNQAIGPDTAVNSANFHYSPDGLVTSCRGVSPISLRVCLPGGQQNHRDMKLFRSYSPIIVNPIRWEGIGNGYPIMSDTTFEPQPGTIVLTPCASRKLLTNHYSGCPVSLPLCLYCSFR
jgi:hypothetical protein